MTATRRIAATLLTTLITLNAWGGAFDQNTLRQALDTNHVIPGVPPAPRLKTLVAQLRLQLDLVFLGPQSNVLRSDKLNGTTTPTQKSAIEKLGRGAFAFRVRRYERPGALAVGKQGLLAVDTHQGTASFSLSDGAAAVFDEHKAGSLTVNNKAGEAGIRTNKGEMIVESNGGEVLVVQNSGVVEVKSNEKRVDITRTKTTDA